MLNRSFKRWVSVLSVASLLLSSAYRPVSAEPVEDPALAVADPGISAASPNLLITELVPDTTNVSSADAYEFIEVYNNSNAPINLKDYDLVYRKGTADGTVWSPEKSAEMILAPKASGVIWVFNDTNAALTVAQFNSNFHTNFVEGVNLFRYYGGGGMANSASAAIPINMLFRDKSGTEIVTASYWDDNDTKPDLGIFYGLPTNGKNMIKMPQAGTYKATPGVVADYQVTPAAEYVNQPPVIAYTPPTQAFAGYNFAVAAPIANAEMTSGTDSVTAAVYYKTDEASVYSSVYMTSVPEGSFQADIPKDALAGRQQLQYYVEAKDSVDTAKTPVFSLPINVGEPLAMDHDPLLQADAMKDFVLDAQIYNLEQGPSVTAAVYYKTEHMPTFRSAAMKSSNGTDYTLSLPKDKLFEKTMQYYIQASNGIRTVKTDTYTVMVKTPPFDPQKAPQLLVTEVVPDSANVSGADGYEFVEVYNNTDRDINYKDYTLRYRYTDKGPDGDLLWPSVPNDVVIPAGKTLVFWVINAQNKASTVADFNANYKTNLVENRDIVRINNDGMANGGPRGLIVASNTGTEISGGYYDSDDETVADKGIFYMVPFNGITKMNQYSAGYAAATPGTVDPIQVPAVPVHLTEDTVVPTIADQTGKTEVSQADNLEIIGDAGDDRQVRTVSLFYRTDKHPAYIHENLTESFADTMYHHTLFSPDLIGRAYVEYYFVVSDGTNESRTEPVKIDITGGPDHSPLRLNLADGNFVFGNKVIKGTGENVDPSALELSIDGEKLTQSLYNAAESDAYFAFDVTNVNYYFKNGITMGEEIIQIFQDPINTFTTLSVPIQADRLKEGNNVVSIRAGTKASPFDNSPTENKDDFEIKNVRLVLADGTELYDPRFANPDTVIKMGDSAGKNPFLDFAFTLPAGKLASKAYKWDTTKVADGAHQVAVANGQSVVTANVSVDNTAPSIKPSVEEGKTYRGAFALNAEVADEYAGLAKVEATLDGKAVELPYATSSSLLSGGNHKFVVTAVDKVGNTGTATVNFEVPNENPLAPELVAPSYGTSGLGSKVGLSVKVSDPTDDDMSVSFFRGFKYDGNVPSVFAGFRGAAATEPPKQQIPDGEAAFETGDYAKISKVDGDYLVDDSVEKFPYQRFEVSLDPSVKATDKVNVSWRGKSLEGRKVTLYAWSPAEQKWKALDTKVAGTADFDLTADVKAGDYGKDSKIQVMIQDEISMEKTGPISDDNYDFTFAWMSDTQYYSKSYPYIYQSIVKWIADNKESNNIKYVIHTGDIVDNADQDYQWKEADKDMKVIEAADIPYGVLAGNHDVMHQTNDYSFYNEYFGEKRFKDDPTYGESYDNNRGHYDLVSSNGNDFIIVYMGWGYGDKEIDWINDVLAKYPNRKAILNFHEYLLVSGIRAPMADKVFERVVKPNKNVFAVLSGHYHNSQLLPDQIDDDGDNVPDRTVYQMLADYQGAPEGGLGYIRLLQFDMDNNKVHVKSYSPYLDDYNYYDPEDYGNKDEFSIDLNLESATKRVATDYVGVRVYADQLIAKKSGVKSGSEVSADWSGLASNATYEWYALAEDANSGNRLSEIWKFSTGTLPGSGSGGGGGGYVPPANNPQPENGIIHVKPQADQSYVVDEDVILKALEGKSATVEIRLDGLSSGSGPVKLQISGKGLAAAKLNDSLLKIVTSDLAISLPAAALPAEASNAEYVTLKVDTGSNAVNPGSIAGAIGSSKDYESTGLVFNLQLAAFKDGKETQLRRFGQKLSVERTLTSDQLSGIDPDYAGIYYLNGEKAEYMGGEFEENKVRFSTNHFSEFAVLEYRKSFVDMQGNWAEPFAQKLAAKHIIDGVDASHFAPGKPVTRADFAVMAVKALGTDVTAGATSFSDVKPGMYYTPYVAHASKLGLIEGSNGRFRPSDSITREEAAVILLRFYRQSHASVPVASGASFADISKASSWAQDAIRGAQSLGLVNGKGGNLFDPKSKVTRAEITKMLLTSMQAK